MKFIALPLPQGQQKVILSDSFWSLHLALTTTFWSPGDTGHLCEPAVAWRHFWVRFGTLIFLFPSPSRQKDKRSQIDGATQNRGFCCKRDKNRANVSLLHVPWPVPSGANFKKNSNWSLTHINSRHPSRPWSARILWLLVKTSLVENNSIIWAFRSFTILGKEAILIPVASLMDTFT